ncbi:MULTISPECIES: hypothetical protein, partial [unclassified Microcoleus]
VRLTLHNFSPKAFGFQVFTTDKKIRPTSAECGLSLPIVDGEEAKSKITTAQDLRVILVVSNALDKNENQLALVKQRFAQSTGWTRLPENPDAEVSIWFSDLKA